MGECIPGDFYGCIVIYIRFKRRKKIVKMRIRIEIE